MNLRLDAVGVTEMREVNPFFDREGVALLDFFLDKIAKWATVLV